MRRNSRSLACFRSTRVADAPLARVISGKHAHDVALLHDQEFFAIELDLGSGPLAKQHTVADFEVDGNQLAGFVAAAWTDRGDFTLRGFFLCRVRNDDAALGFFFSTYAFDHDTVMQRTKFRFSHDGSFWRFVSGSACDSKPTEFADIRRRKEQNSSRPWQSPRRSANCAAGNMSSRCSCQAIGQLIRW